MKNRIDLSTFEIDTDYFGPVELLITVKSFDLEAIRKRYIASRKRSKSGSVERRQATTGGIVYMKIQSGNIVEQRILAKLLEPRGIDITQNKLAVSSEEKIYIFETGRSKPKILEHNWLSYIHTVRFNQQADKILVTSSGVDTLMEFEIKTGLLTWEWLAWENGWCEGENPATGEKYILTRNSDAAQLIKSKGLKPLLILNPQKEWLPTALRAAFINTAEYGENDVILATFFHHGWVLGISRDGSYNSPIIEGLSKPHGGMLIKDGCLVTDTAGGRVILTNGREQSEYDFNSLPGKIEELADLEWLQISKILNNSIITIDSNRNRITFFDPKMKKIMHIPFDKNWAMQEFVVTEKLNHQIEMLVNYFRQ